jgi:hypothetical protein
MQIRTTAFRRLFAGLALAFGAPLVDAACVTGSSGEVQLQAVLDNLSGAPNSVAAASGCVADGADGRWQTTSAQSSSTLIFEYAGYASLNAFGIYDPYDRSRQLEIFSGSAAETSARVLGGIATSAGYQFYLQSAGLPGPAVTFTGNLFGFYLASPDGVFRSESTLNPDGAKDHFVAFKLPFAQFGNANTYLLGWEDLAGGGDRDFNDMGVLVSSVAPVPLPAAVWLMLSGLLGVGAVARRRNRAISAVV